MLERGKEIYSDAKRLWPYLTTKEKSGVIGMTVAGATALGLTLGGAYQLGSEISQIRMRYLCAGETVPNLDYCTEDQPDLAGQILPIKRLSESPHMSLDMRNRLTRRLNDFDALLADDSIIKRWRRHRDKDNRTAKVIMFRTSKDEPFMIVITGNESSGTSADDINSTAHEALVHGVNAYVEHQTNPQISFAPDTTEQGKEKKYLEEKEAEWFGYYLEEVARREGYPSELTHDENMKRFGGDMARVVYELESKGFGPSDPVYQYISDMSIRFIYNSSASYTTETDSKPSQEESRAVLRGITRRWEGFPQKGSRNWIVIRNLVHRGLLHPSYLPNSPRTR